jgi:type IV secretion system protein VirB4
MYLLKELHTDITRLSDLLLWGGMVHGPCPAVLLNKDGTYQATLRYRGQDVTMLAHAQCLVYLHRLNLLLKRLGSGWALLADEWHEETTAYPDSRWTNPAACFVDAARRALFEAGVHFEGQYYLTLCWQPPSSRQQRWYDGFFATREREQQQSDDTRNLAAFVAGLERFADALEPLLPALAWCTPAETITYLHRCVSWDRHPVALPEVPMYLDALLTTADFLPGNTPMLGERFVRPICIKTWPRELGIHVPAALQGVPFPYRFTVRWLALDKLDAQHLLNDYQKKWAMQVKPFWTLILEAISRQQSTKVNQEAVENAASLQRARASLDLDHVSFGFLTPTVTVWGETREELAAREREIVKILHTSECLVEPERVNAPAAWLGTLPGDVYHNVRNPPLPSLALAFLLPHAAIWAGAQRDDHVQGPPLFTASSDGVPFRYVMHQGEVGHTVIMGPTRGGKSGLMGFMAMQFLRYPDAQVFLFDKDCSLYCATLMAGGSHYHLGGNAQRGFQPLGNIDQDEAERRWAQEWLQDLFVTQDLLLSPEEREEIWVALLRLAELPRPLRRLRTFRELFQVNRLKPGLAAFVEGGRYSFFDAEADSFGLDWWTCFEMAHLLELPGAVPHALSYIFHQMDARFDGRPTAVFLDEAWQYMAHPIFAPRIAAWLKSKAKMNVSVILSSQEIVDASRTALWQAIQGSCRTWVFLPNSAALNPDVLPHYHACGLSDAHIGIIATSRQKQDYLYKTDAGTRLFQLRLGPVERLLCAASTPEEIAALRTLQAQPLQEPLPAMWLRSNGLIDEAEVYGEQFPLDGAPGAAGVLRLLQDARNGQPAHM